MSEFDPNVTQPAVTATPTTVDTPVPATQGTPSMPTTTTTAQGPAPGQGGSQAPATGAPGEGYVPSYRLRETRESVLREARAYLDQQRSEFEREKAELNKKIQALAGFGPQPDPEVEGVRDQFGKLYPNLAKIESQADRIFQLIERAGDMESQTNHYWTSYGQNAVTQLFDAAESDLGSPLSDEGKRALHASFVGYIQSSPELVNMYAANPNFAKEYWKAFSSSFIDPVRRVSAAAAQGRTQVPLPQDTPAAAPRVGQPEKPSSLEDRVSRSWTAYNQSKRG
jgi:hypothetical protein